MRAEQLNAEFGIAGILDFVETEHGLVKARISLDGVTGELYLQGAQVTAWQPPDERPVLFTSPNSAFAPGRAIRGGCVFAQHGDDLAQVSERGRGGGPDHRGSLSDLARRLGAVAPVRSNEFALRVNLDPYEMTVFPDGRAIVKGTTDIGVARSLYARYIGA